MFMALTLIGGPAANPAHAQENGVIKVYVVRTAEQNGGAAETLPEIARRTLGTPSRANEIFTLNQGRAQRDGGALRNPNQTLNPGWVLRLPADASGPFVQFGRDNGATSGPPRGLQIPTVLAALGGVLLLGLTLLILFRRWTGRAARRIGGMLSTAGNRLTAPGRRRRARTARRQLVRQWRGDITGLGTVRVALAEAAQALPPTAPGPVTADLTIDTVRVLPVPEIAPPPPWQPDHEHGWFRPRALNPGFNGAGEGRPVRIGGTAERQVFVDLTYCDGVIAFTGDQKTTNEILSALLNEIAGGYPDLTVAVLGTPPPGVSGQIRRFGHRSQLVAELRPAGPASDSPTVPAAQRHRVAGVIAVPADVPPSEAVEVARLCGSPGSTWLGLIAGDVPGAHWRCQVHNDGTMNVLWLDRTLIAPL